MLVLFPQNFLPVLKPNLDISEKIHQKKMLKKYTLQFDIMIILPTSSTL